MLAASSCSAKLNAVPEALPSPPSSRPPDGCALCRSCAGRSDSNCCGHRGSWSDRCSWAGAAWPVASGRVRASVCPWVRSPRFRPAAHRSFEALPDCDDVARRGPNGRQRTHQFFDRAPCLRVALRDFSCTANESCKADPDTAHAPVWRPSRADCSAARCAASGSRSFAQGAPHCHAQHLHAQHLKV